jgi:hypothetical protein
MKVSMILLWVWTICTHGELIQKAYGFRWGGYSAFYFPIYGHLVDVYSLSAARSELRGFGSC